MSIKIVQEPENVTQDENEISHSWRIQRESSGS